MERINTLSVKANNRQFKNVFVKWLLLLFIILGFNTVFGQTKTTVTTAGTTSFTAPTGVTKVTVQAWGAGGAGGGSNTNKKPGSGGGGGAYNFSNSVTVTPGTTYTNSVIVGAGGTGGTGNGGNGNTSSVTFGSSLSVNGGKGGNGNNTNTSPAGDGGAAGSFAGGNGGSATQNINGPGAGGGGSAGTAAAGNSGANGIGGAGGVGGVAVTGGGAGGNGGVSGSNGSAGSAPGGGGGGGGDKNGATNVNGGNGAAGQVIISYFLLTSTSNVTVCIGSAATITVTGTATNLPVGTYTVLYDSTAPNATTNTSRTMTVSTAGTGTFTTLTLSNSGSTGITITSITATLGGITYGTSYDTTGNANNKATITVNGVPTTATNTSTQTICSTGTATLAGNSPSVGTGSWSVVSGPSTLTSQFSSLSNPAAVFTPAGGAGSYVVRWTISNSPCTASSADATITVNGVPTTATNTSTQTICSSGTATLAANSPSVGTGSWSVVSGPSTLTSQFSSLSNPAAVFTPAGGAGSYVVRWTISNSPCTASTANATITVSNANTWTGGASTTAWTTPGNWSCGIVPISATDVTISTASFYPEISSNVTINSLTLDSGTTLKVNPTYYLTVTDVIDNDGTLTIENNANLLQTNNVSNTGSGATTVKRNSSALLRLDYTLWSSPVSGQGLYAFSPFTFANRFYVYRTTTNLYNNADVGFSITGLNGNGVNGTDGPPAVPFATAKGYLIRVPWNHPAATPTVWNGTFTGVPNNGNITYIMTSGASGFRFNLVGNPYPSPISMSQFVFDNSTKITGTLYFWRETNNTSANNAYCSWAGGTFVTNSEAQVFDPSGIIRTGQGFIVEAQASQTVLSFNNGQRSSDNTDQFFKNNSIANSTDTVETNRFWLNLTNTSGAFSQMAAGYMTDATDGVDIYDGKNINTGNVLLNSILNNEEYTIQGKSLPFNTADVIPLRYKITDAGDYTITLDHIDGLFTGGSQPIYLKDNLTNTIHDLNTGAYSFTSTAGTFSDRFEIVYALPLGTGNPIFTANNVIIYNRNNEFAINTGNTIMSSVKVFDIRGRLLQERKAINASQTTIGGGLANQVLLVQITSEDGVTVTKKVIR